MFLEPLLLGTALCLQDPAPTPVPPRELPRLAAPVRVEADGAPITAVIGHAAPFFVDHDGDGLRDLIVGMFGSDVPGVRGGTGRCYRNIGSQEAPRFAAFTTLLADGKPAVMESS